MTLTAYAIEHADCEACGAKKGQPCKIRHLGSVTYIEVHPERITALTGGAL